MWQYTRSVLAASCATFIVVVGLSQGKPEFHPSAAALARYESAKTIWDLATRRLKMGFNDIGADPADEARFLWSLRLADSAVAAGKSSALDAYAEHVTRMEELAATTEGLSTRGRKSEKDIAVTKYFVADAKMRLDAVAK